ncbi:hypothetical protein CsSME_00052830 [Camellia sinensis var. sinensis]
MESNPPNPSTSPRGLTLFIRSWLPLFTIPLRGIILMVHDYDNNISHNQSSGLEAFVPNVNLVVDDCLSFFKFITTPNPQFQSLSKFLFEESMDDMICFLIHFKNPSFFNEAILIAPMCKISDKVKPRWPIPEILTFFTKFAPILVIVPTADLLDMPIRYNGKPRLGVVKEFLRVIDYVSKHFADVMNDLDVSRELYEQAKSKDKTLKIYDGMMHSLLFGETDENEEIV